MPRLADVCRYVLFALNRARNFSYVKKLGLDGPTADAADVIRLDDESEEGGLGTLKPASFLNLLRTGGFGPPLLDDISRPYQRFRFEDWGGETHRERQGYSERDRARKAARGADDGNDDEPPWMSMGRDFRDY